MKDKKVFVVSARVLRMLIGLYLFALGQVFCIQGSIGLAPWDVLNSGLAHQLGGTFGMMNIAVGILLVIIDLLLGQKLGIGTICNAVLIGTFIDLTQNLHLIPQAQNFLIGLLAMLFGLFLISLGTVLYIGAGFGSGPRDSLMVALRCRLPKVPVGAIRGGIEATVVLIGWILGGTVGIGTVIAVFGISAILQATFHICRFDPTTVQQQSLVESFDALRQWLRKGK